MDLSALLRRPGIIKRILFFITIGFLQPDSQSLAQTKKGIDHLQYLQTLVVPPSSFQGTRVGGLSGIDYNPADGSFYFICDDKQARFYKAKLHFSGQHMDSLQLLNVYPLEGGRPGNADAESIRYNPHTQQLFWSDEGERKVGSATVLTHPSIHIADLLGKEKGQLTLPEILHMKPTEQGPRNNGALEGISFNEQGTVLYTCVEEPLIEDSPRAGLDKGPVWVRFFQLELPGGKNTKQFAYPLEPVAYPSTPADAFKVNGISEILYLGGNELLVIERSFSFGRPGCVIKVFIADFGNATDIKDMHSLSSGEKFVPMQKILLLNMESLGIYTDNVEGVTFGPTLPNGNRSLLFVSDNNFQTWQETQLLLFEVK